MKRKYADEEHSAEKKSPAKVRDKNDRRTDGENVKKSITNDESAVVKQKSVTSNKLVVLERTGDIFDAPSTAVVVHACNCEGTWGAGIAKAFKQHFPNAFPVYAEYCADHGPSLVGKGLLIPPQRDYDPFVGCLFTSKSKGRKKDRPAAILEATGPAMQDLLQQIDEWDEKPISDQDSEQKKAATTRHGTIDEVRMCKINSGLFAVPWARTKAVIEELGCYDSSIKSIHVISRPE